MNVTVLCPQCGTQYSIQRDLLGRRSKCAKCGSAFVLSESIPAVAPARAIEPAAEEIAIIPEVAVAPRARRAKTPKSIPNPVATPAATAAPSFWALRLLARSYEVFAVISLVAVMVPVVLMVQTVVQFPSLATLLVLRYAIAIVSLLASALILFLIAQLVRLILQVEQNTRETSIACRQLAEHLCGIEPAE
jgi:predicted Zn finger-like uncharacterized protein